MKKANSMIVMFILFFTVAFGSLGMSVKTEAADPTPAIANVLKAPKAGAGYWVYTSNGRRYVLNSTGDYARTAWLKIDGSVYYFTSKGYARTGFKYFDGRWYFFQNNGKLKLGWYTTSDGKKYYFWKNPELGKKAGSAAVGKVKIGSYYYYFSKYGVRQSGWQKIGNYYYYFRKTNGTMATNTTVAGYKVDASGRRVKKVSGTTTTTKTVNYWVGDSRTVGLGIAKNLSADKTIAKVGEGYTWFSSTAIYTLKRKLDNNPKAIVVLNFGVNDISNISKYISKYKALFNCYPNAKFYVMSVNPIDSKYTYGYVTNTKIKSFNAKMKEAFPDKYIDTYTYLKNNGFQTVDGLHYTTTTYKKIYTYVTDKINS